MNPVWVLPHQAIFLKELIAALMGIQEAVRQGFRRPLLLIDNTAAAAALESPGT
jgi:hypothetical protein